MVFFWYLVTNLIVNLFTIKFVDYHSLDPAQAIERIKEAKGILDEDDIKRGVEILREVRRRNGNHEKYYVGIKESRKE